MAVAESRPNEAAAAQKKARSKPRKAGSKPKKTKLVEVTGYDLFYQLIYMSAIAASGIERRRIFGMAAELPRKSAAYFRRVHLLSSKLGYDYSESCRLVGERVKSDVMKSLLLRLSDALSAGKPESSFLAEEATIQTDAYEGEYERDLESLKKWTDGYAALVISSALIIIVNLISVLIYPIESSMIGVLVLVSLASSGGGAWILWRTGPAEQRAEFKEDGPPIQRRARLLAFAGIGGIVAVAIPAGLLGLPLGYTLLLSGAFLMPSGLIAAKASREVAKKDKDIGQFLRSLGGFAASTGTTVSESLDRIDLSPFPFIRSDLERLRARMRASISPQLCWQRLADETGSRLIRETATIFVDAVGLGGAADTVGLFCARYAALTNTLRSRRVVVSSTFTSLTIVMHGVLAALMVIIMEVIRNFTVIVEASMEAATAAVESTSAPLPTFGSPELGLLNTATMGMVIALAVINALAIVATDGGHTVKTALYLGILLIVSGLCFVFVPPMVANIVQI